MARYYYLDEQGLGGIAFQPSLHLRSRRILHVEIIQARPLVQWKFFKKQSWAP